jgi:hypothetical protein
MGHSSPLNHNSLDLIEAHIIPSVAPIRAKL